MLPSFYSLNVVGITHERRKTKQNKWTKKKSTLTKIYLASYRVKSAMNISDSSSVMLSLSQGVLLVKILREKKFS